MNIVFKFHTPTLQTLITLHGCAGWYGATLVANSVEPFSSWLDTYYVLLFGSADVPPPYNQPAGAYPQQPAGAYPQQPVGEYQQQPVGAYPAPQPTGGYQQPAVAYAPQAGQPQFVVTQQPVVTAVVGGPQPPDYMVSSILVCLFCFWPTGIFAIYYSSRRNNLLASGDVSGANRMANSAKNLMIASIVVGVVWIVLVIIWSILRGVALAATVTYSRHGY